MIKDNEKYNAELKPNSAFLKELEEKLPQFFTKDNTFDIRKFETALKEKNINELSEGYQLDFIGKDYARRQVGELPSTVIVPDKDQNSKEGEKSKNLFFTGDNLEVLKHLQRNYQRKVDFIYIDPPYNTGSDGFAYPDKFEYTDTQLASMFGLNDEQIIRLKSIQGRASHSAWLTFMYPRLALSKALLKDDGIIFISIDDNEQANLKEICDEIFGEQNLISQICHKARASVSNDKIISNSHNIILLYAKNEKKVFEKRHQIGIAPNLKDFDKRDKRGAYKLVPVDGPGGAGKGNPIYEFLGVKKYWRFSEETMRDMYSKGLIVKTKNNIQQKYYLEDAKKSRKTTTSWWDEKFYTSSATSKLSKLMGGKYFNNPKPVELILKMLEMFTFFNKSAIVLDYFAGSSTTADAVIRMNAKDNGNRRYIMIQKPEKTYYVDKSGKKIAKKGSEDAFKAGYRSIDQISRERIKKSVNKVRENKDVTLSKDFDGSFKHYYVVTPTVQTIDHIDKFDPKSTQLFTNMVDEFSSKSLGVKGSATGEETILTTWLVSDGYDFNAKISSIEFNGYKAHIIEDNRLYLINEGWNSGSTEELLNTLGARKLNIQTIVLFGYSFNVAELRELEIGLKQLDNSVNLVKRY